MSFVVNEMHTMLTKIALAGCAVVALAGWIRLAPLPAGLLDDPSSVSTTVLDRNGAVLAANRPNFRLLVARDKDLDTEATLKTLANFVPLDDIRQRRLLKDINSAPKRAPVSVMEDMTWEQFSAVSVRTPPPVVPRDPFGLPVQRTSILLSALPPARPASVGVRSRRVPRRSRTVSSTRWLPASTGLR